MGEGIKKCLGKRGYGIGFFLQIALAVMLGVIIIILILKKMPV